MKRRIIAALMALCLCIGLLPATALAADDIPERYRFLNPGELREASVEKAGYSPDDVWGISIGEIVAFDIYGTQTYSDVLPGLLENQFYSIGSERVHDAGGKLLPNELDRIRVQVTFCEGFADWHTEYVFFDISEFDEVDRGEASPGVDYVSYQLNGTTASTDGHKVTFMYQPVGNWEVYNIVYVPDGEQIGNRMPPAPDYGTQDFVSWQTNRDGGGVTLTETTVINEPWTVYGTKTSAGGGTAYHVMRDSDSGRYNALQDELADLYNAENGTAYGKGDVRIDTIQVNGEDGEYTNPIYHTNGWNDGSSYYYIYNIDAYASDSTPDKKNTRVPVNEVTGITVTGGIGDQEFTLTIPEDEFSLEEITNAGSTDTIIEIRVLEKLDGIKKEIVKNQADVPEGIKDITLPDENNKVTIPDGDSVTLLYKITVTGDEKAQYIVTDEGATQVSGDQLSGTLDADGEAVIYVTKTFTEATDGKLTNSATLQNNETTLPPDSGDDEDEVIVDVDGEDDDYAITGIDKALVDSETEKSAAQNAGIVVGNYTYPNDEGTVIIPEDDTVTLLYAITVEGKPGASFTVTDTGATLVAIGSVAITQTDDTFTGSIPADAASITFYVSKTFDADDLNGEVGNQVLTNEASITTTDEGGANPDNDEDTEETPAEEEQDMIPLDVYVYLRVEGSGQNGELTDEDLATIAEWELEKSNPDDYYILGKLSGVGLPEDILTDGELTYEKYATYIKQAFTDSKFMAYKENSVIDEDFLNGIAWENLVWASGAPGYESETQEGNCLHLDGVLKLESSYDLTYDANGGTIDGKETYTVSDISAAEAKDYSLSKEIVPTHSNDAVVFAGWTTDGSAQDQIYSVEDAKNGSVPAAVNTVDLTKNDTVYALWSYDEDNDDTPDINEIIVTPADITIYTGGAGYGGVTNAAGNIIGDTSGSGLPKPGYHITLPAGLAAELGLKDGTDLADKLSFSYNVDDEVTDEAVTRAWDMTCAGIYSTDPTRYVYSLNKDSVTNTDVRLLFKDAGGNVKENDQIDMSANAPSAEYTMTINPGGLDQKAIKAVLTADDGTTVERSVFIDTGVLTIRSITDPDQEVTTPIIASDGSVTGGTITAQAGENMVYHVNDSEVKVDAGRVELLVDEVSGDEDFNKALGEDAISEVKEDEALHASLTNPMYDLAYLDLVDAENGNAVVTVESGKLTIYWPVPAYAADNSDFYVVHYHGGMDRETAVDQNQLADVANTVTKVEKTADGEHITFTTSTFSPFALVYEMTSTPPVTQYTVEFKSGSHGSLSGTTTFQVNAGDKVPSVPAVNEDHNYDFAGWKGSDGNTYTSSQILDLSITKNMTFTAQYKRESGGGEYNPKDATLRFNSRGGTEFDDIVHKEPFEYNPYNKIPTRPGYRFTGWYDSSRLDNRYDEDEEISVPMGITTVWAGWEETSVPSMLNGDDHYAYIQGYSDGTVRPNANITRAQVATIFFRLLDEDVRDDNLTTYNTFPDVDEDYWANTAISTMASLGVINGRNSGLFDPDAYITRAEFAAICARFDDSGVDGITTFTDTVGHWAEDEISRAAALGWIQGYSDGTFRPNQYITRAQAVTMINRVLCRLPEDTDDLLSGMNTWTDCHEDDWFYLAIQEATNSHDFVAKDRVYESWTDLNRAPDWSRYE